MQAWHPIEAWCDLLRQAALDATLFSVASMAVPPRTARKGLRDEGRSARGLWFNTARCGPDITALPLGRRPLVLIHANGYHTATDQHHQGMAMKTWQLLLPPVVQQPRLWRQLKRLGLLPMHSYDATDSVSWLQQLLQAPHLLPAHLTLLEQAPWREVGLRAVPPPEPLDESLWLLLRQGEEKRSAIQALAAQLKEEVHRGIQPMG